MLLNCTHDEDFVKICMSFSLKIASTTYIFPVDAENDETERCRKKIGLIQVFEAKSTLSLEKKAIKWCNAPYF